MIQLLFGQCRNERYDLTEYDVSLSLSLSHIHKAPSVTSVEFVLCFSD